MNGVGTNGSKQTVYYAEVSDRNLAPGAGGGLRDHGEYIEVIYLPVDKAKVRMYRFAVPRLRLLC